MLKPPKNHIFRSIGNKFNKKNVILHIHRSLSPNTQRQSCDYANATFRVRLNDVLSGALKIPLFGVMGHLETPYLQDR